MLALLVGLSGASPAFCAAAPPARYHWSNVAIRGGGFVTGVQFHPGTRGLAYARTDVGGAYRWDDDSASWTPITDWVPWTGANLMGIESLAIDPSDPSRVYLAAGTYNHPDFGRAAILRSSDRGRTFARADLPFGMGGNEAGRGNGERLAVDPNDGRVIFFGSRSAGLWRSADRGVTWQRVAGFPAIATSPASASGDRWSQAVGIVVVVFDPRRGAPGQPSQVIYAGVSTRETALFRSTDGGVTWSPVPQQPVGLRPTQAELSPDGMLYLSYGDDPGPNTMRDGAVWKFDADAGTWTDITPLRPTAAMPFGYGAVAVDRARPGALVVATFCKWTGGDEIFRSTDGGRTWHALLRGAEWDHTGAPWTRTMKPHWIGDVAIDPFNADRVSFTTGYGIWLAANATAATDGGAVRWRFANDGLEETVPLALISPPVGAPLLSGLGDIDGFRHDDLAVSPLQFTGPRFTNTGDLAFAASAPHVIARVGLIRHHPDGAVRGAYSRDSGAHWMPFGREPPGGQGGGSIAVGADGTAFVWTPRGGAPHVTRDDGATWQRCAGLAAPLRVMADGADAARFYAYDAQARRLLVSEDGARSFAARGPEFPAVGPRPGGFMDGFTAWVEAAPGRIGELWVSIRGGGLHRSRDGGATFVRVDAVGQAHSLGFGKPAPDRDEPTVFIAGTVGGTPGLFRSDDSGATWLRLNDDAHQFGWVDRITGDPRVFGRVYFATSGRGIIYGEPR